jgi:hypothetical protein
LAAQIDRLDAVLDGLAEALNDSVADAVKATVGEAAREAVQQALSEALDDERLMSLLTARRHDGQLVVRREQGHPWAGGLAWAGCQVALLASPATDALVWAGGCTMAGMRWLVQALARLFALDMSRPWLSSTLVGTGLVAALLGWLAGREIASVACDVFSTVALAFQGPSDEEAAQGWGVER